MENRHSEIPSSVIGTVPKRSSVLGLGCWAFGGADWGGQNDMESIEAIKAAFETGITHFDTAQSYGRGHSEELVGRALRGVRDKVFIASKTMFTPKERVEKSVLASLKRLGTEYIDLFYIHWPRKDADLEGMMEGLVSAREKGLIKGIGVSNFSVEQMKRVSKAGKIDAHQMCYNLLWRWGEKDLIPYCRENGISVVAYCSLAQGILTGKFSSTLQFVPGDHRKSTVLFDEQVWPHVYDGVEKLKSAALSATRPLNELAIRWILSRPGLSTVLAGARNSLQVHQNVKAMDGEIDPAVFDSFTSISDTIAASIPDTGNIFRWYP
ncbi:MAG: aldo/keto reductase [Fibrobacter sp.]|nr:aldo/keto reductase [Fibrobacter sp.]